MFDQRELSDTLAKVFGAEVQKTNALIQENVNCFCEFVEKKFHDKKFDFNELAKQVSDIQTDLIKCFTDILLKKLEEFNTEFCLCVTNSLSEVEKQLVCLSKQYKMFEVALEDYFNERVKLNEEKMETATEKFEAFINTLQDYLEFKWPNYPVGKISLTGSVADGTKVCLPNEFDVSMPLKIPLEKYVSYQQPNDHLLKISFDTSTLQYFTDSNNNFWLKLNEVEKQVYIKENKQRATPKNYCLSPELISEQLKKILVAFKNDENVIENLAGKGMKLDFARSEHFYKFGPAIDMLVVYEGPKRKGSFVVDIVPFIQEKEGKEHVINPYYTEFVFSGGGKGGSYVEMFANPTIYWRRSHSSLETKFFQHLNVNIQKPLMIWKSFALLNVSLKNPILNSFHFKNMVLLLAYKDIEEISSHWDKGNNKEDDYVIFQDGLRKWSSYPLGLQVIEIARMMYEFLRDGHMPWASHRSVKVNFKPNNILLVKKHDIEKMRHSLSGYLEEILSSQNWCRLVSDCQLKVEENECPFSGKKV